MFNVSEKMIFLFLLFGHWIADFLCQNNWMALNKSEKVFPLFIHCFLYSLVMLPFFLFIEINLIKIFGILFISHLFIDFVSSKITSYLWNKKKIRMFFNIIGLDQFLHISIIFLIYFKNI